MLTARATSTTIGPMPKREYADVITTGPETQILSSATVWEHRCLMLDDDLSPDLIPPTLRDSISDLFREATHRGVALDWSSLKVHIHKTDWDNESNLVVRVDVL